MVDKNKKKNKNKYDEDINDIVSGKKIRKRSRRKDRHGSREFTKKHSDDIEYFDNYEKFK